MAVAMSCAAISTSSSTSTLGLLQSRAAAVRRPRKLSWSLRKVSALEREGRFRVSALESFSAGSREGLPPLLLLPGVLEAADWRNGLRRQRSSHSSSINSLLVGVAACGDNSNRRRRRRSRREQQGLRRLRFGGENSEVEDGDGLSIKDMERYLDELSIEYDSVWDTKPAWCQPWTIALTGVIGISASWLLVHLVVVTAVVSVLVSVWWFLFLYSYPLAYAQMIAQRRKDQKDGLEDTFGMRKGTD